MDEKDTVYRLSVEYVRRGKRKNAVVYSSSLSTIELYEERYMNKYPSATITRRTYKLESVERLYGY